MEFEHDYPLKALNTFGVAATAARYVRFDAEAEIGEFLDRNPLPAHHLILGGGSNLLFVGDFDGTILHPVFKGIEVIDEEGDQVRVKAMAGEAWDDLVVFAVANGLGGIENLSLIPGSVGACAVQNIGAYGVEVQSVVEGIEAVAVDGSKPIRFSPKDCGFGYRFSHFKGPWAGRYIITAVVFKLRRRPQFVTTYPGVLEAVGNGTSVNLHTLRRAIISIRQSKLPDPAAIGNAGSFFKNPVVDSETLNGLLKAYADMPHYSQGGDQFKLPAGWLIERSGQKGRRSGRAAVHDQQALVLVNLGSATGYEILELAEEVNAAVYDRFNIELEREVLVIR